MNPRPYVTYLLIAVNIAGFAIIAWQQNNLMLNSAKDVIAILDAGANLNPLTSGGQPWRILTCMFLHFGVIHLAVNMYALQGLGSLLEPILGPARFAILYLICGIAASIASLFFNTYVISAGASGAIFGLYGYSLGAELISAYHDREKLKKVLINFAIFIVINGFIAGQVQVDMSGHIGGAVAGLLMAAFHFKFRMILKTAPMAFILVILPFFVIAVPKDQLRYYEIFQRVMRQEKLTNNMLQEKQDEALRDSLVRITDEWKNIYQDLKQLSRVPATVAEDTATLSKYITLRIDENNYRVKVLEQSYIYLDSLETLGSRFDSLPRLKHSLNYKIAEEESRAEHDTTLTDRPSNLHQVQEFYDANWKPVDNQVDAKYYRIGMRDSLKRWQGPVRDYFINGDIQMKGEYVDGLHDGVFIYYTDHKTYSSAGRYEKERSVGKWENFHWNGKKESETFYNTRTFTGTIWDSLGNVLIANGNGDYKSWYSNGALKEEGSYYNGRREGYFFGYYDDGKPYYKEMYQNNLLISGVSEGRDGRRYVYDGLSQLPAPAIGMKMYRSYIQKNKRIPADNVQGVVKVLFSVGIDGSLWDFVILESISPDCDREAIRLIREGGSWRPALLHGQHKVQSQGYMEVRF